MKNFGGFSVITSLLNRRAQGLGHSLGVAYVLPGTVLPTTSASALSRAGSAPRSRSASCWPCPARSPAGYCVSPGHLIHPHQLRRRRHHHRHRHLRRLLHLLHRGAKLGGIGSFLSPRRSPQLERYSSSRMRPNPPNSLARMARSRRHVIARRPLPIQERSVCCPPAICPHPISPLARWSHL